jgi:hypothetical protein
MSFTNVSFWGVSSPPPPEFPKWEFFGPRLLPWVQFFVEEFLCETLGESG